MTFFYKPTFLTALLLFSISAKSETEEILTLQSALQIAEQSNPGLAYQQARQQAISQIASQVGSLPDPVISFNALNLPSNSFDPAQENMTQFQGGISQSLPFFGKLALREQAAIHQSEAASHDVTEQRNRLLREVKNSWWQLFYLQQAVKIIQINHQLLNQFVDIARTKYEVGEGLQQDVLLAQLELSTLMDKQMSLQAAVKTHSALLNSLLALPPNRVIKMPEQVDSQLPELLSEAQLFQLAQQHRALLAAQRTNIAQAESRIDLAKKDLLPDFNVGVFYGGRDDTPEGKSRADFVSFKLSMTVPLYAEQKQQKAIAQRNSEAMQQRYQLEQQWNQTRAEISSAYHDFQQNKQQSLLFTQGIIPQARQTVASMLSGYQVNKVDFLNLLRSQLTLYNYETRYWKVLSQAHQALARLTAAVGKDEIYE